MRADRLLAILLHLQANRRMTARELARRLEVSPRTVHRDMEALSAAGVPVYAERGAGGGWILPDEYRTNLTGLSEAEVQALFVAAPGRLLADLGLRRAADGALVKLLAALPAAHRRDADFARQRIHVDTAGWRGAREPVPCLPQVQEAVWRDRRLRFRYARQDGEPVERVADPLGLVAKGQIWYLVAVVEGDVRTYRVSRLRSAEVLDESCRRPEVFDLQAFWERSSDEFVAALPRYPLLARVEPAILPRLEVAGWFTQVEHIGPPDGDGRLRVRLVCQTEDEALRYALGLGPWLEVLEPESLRRQVAQAAARVVALYAEMDLPARY
jgi:predicted DNA-binding transcriptional regulator YafY